MKKLIATSVIGIILFGFANTVVRAQAMNLVEKKEVYTKQHIPQKNPIPYPFVREADVYWSKTVWRVINLKEKMNQDLYFPTQNIGDRKNLVNLILEVLQSPEPEHPVYAYKPTLYSTEYEFDVPLSLDEALREVADSTFETYRDSITGQAVTRATGFGVNPSKIQDITKLYVKEKWFIDRRRSVMDVRILGICPVLITPEEVLNPQTQNYEPTGAFLNQPLFWIYYPEFRYYFSRNFIFNSHNDAQPISFDDLFMQRRFSSYIYRESNVYNNRDVISYATGMDAMFEAEKINNEIRIKEHDLWEY